MPNCYRHRSINSGGRKEENSTWPHYFQFLDLMKEIVHQNDGTNLQILIENKQTLAGLLYVPAHI